LNDKYTTNLQIAELQKELERARKPANEKKIFKLGKHKMSKIFNWVFFILLFVGLSAILTTIIIAKSRGETPAVFGYQLYVVQSGSMEPTFNIGTLILSKIPTDPSKLKKGDVVTFTKKGMTITHRIFEVINDNETVKYKTKGDNPGNSVDPSLLTTDRVKAVFVFRIPLI
jgi:signal peptidase